MDRTDIPAGERIDDIGFGGLKLIQKPDEFCYGIDSVLLADFAAVNHGSADGPAADLGTGSGVGCSGYDSSPKPNVDCHSSLKESRLLLH